MGGRKVRASNVAVVSNISLMLGKLIVGIMISSVTLISLAADSFFDLLGSSLTNYSLRKSEEPPDPCHPYGHGKYENISGGIQAVLIFLAAGLIIYESARRLMDGSEVGLVDAGIAILLISTIVDLCVSRYLGRVAKEEDSIALEADALHLSTDVLANIAVMVALVVIRITGWEQLDPLIGIVIAIYILRSAWKLSKRSGGGLLDVSLPPKEEEVIIDAIRKYAPRYFDYHQLRTRKAGPKRFIDLHLTVDPRMSVEESHNIANMIEEEIQKELVNADVLIHIEPWESEVTPPNDR